MRALARHATALTLLGALSAFGAQAVRFVSLEPDGEPTVLLVLHADGVQVYQCRDLGEPEPSYAWQVQDLYATLFDRDGHGVGRQDSGDRWEASDGSRLEGQLRTLAPASEEGALPWQLLAARSTGGSGLFSRINQVQRLNTAGGMPPRQACTAHNQGQTAPVPFRADYYFYADS